MFLTWLKQRAYRGVVIPSWKFLQNLNDLLKNGWGRCGLDRCEVIPTMRMESKGRKILYLLLVRYSEGPDAQEGVTITDPVVCGAEVSLRD